MKATFFAVILNFLLLPVALCATYQTPPPTFEAKEYTNWNNLKRAGKSRRGDIYVPFKANDGSDDFVSMTRVDLVGNAYDRGYAHGFLL